MEVKATLKYIRMSPRKIRLVADVIRDLDIVEAEHQLQLILKKAARPVLKLLNSAVANAENNFNIKKDNLYIKKISADGGPTLKRWRARAFGKAAPIRKRTSHITIILDEKVAAAHKEKTKKKLSQPETIKSIPAEKLIEKELNEERKQEAVSKNFKEGKKDEPFDVRMVGKHRHQQHLDKVRMKKGGTKNSPKGLFRQKIG